MIGNAHETVKSSSIDAVSITRTVESLKIDLETILEELELYKAKGLKTLILTYQSELRTLRESLLLSQPHQNIHGVRNVALWDDDVTTFQDFFTKLLNEAGKEEL